MKVRRKHSIALKRHMVEELLAGTSLAQISRRYEISSSLVRQWKKAYEDGKLSERSANATAMEERIRELERMVGQLTMENNLLKKAVEYTLQRRREVSSIITGPNLERSRKDVS